MLASCLLHRELSVVPAAWKERLQELLWILVFNYSHSSAFYSRENAFSLVVNQSLWAQLQSLSQNLRGLLAPFVSFPILQSNWINM